MEEEAENLLKQLETEGQKIAKYRKLILNLTLSGEVIDCSRMTHLCNQLNEHISSFDKIDNLLVKLDTIC